MKATNWDWGGLGQQPAGLTSLQRSVCPAVFKTRGSLSPRLCVKAGGGKMRARGEMEGAGVEMLYMIANGEKAGCGETAGKSSMQFIRNLV